MDVLNPPALPVRGTSRRLAIESLRTGVSLVLKPLESHLLRCHGEARGPVVFILGPPRSGTTLLYEVLVRRYEFAFISNLAHRLYRTPVAASRLGRRVIRSWSGSFESRHGHIAGWGAPSEGGWVWNRWFPQEHYLDAAAAGGLPVETIRRTVHAMAAVLAAPFLNKNVMHSVHMRLLDVLFPDCRFLRVSRDPRDNARSILRARASGGGPTAADGWWSVRPPRCEHLLGADAASQAVAQVVEIQRCIDRDASALGSDRLLDVRYAELCADTSTTLARIETFLQHSGVALHPRAVIPASFPPSTSISVDPEQEAVIARSLARSLDAHRG